MQFARLADPNQPKRGRCDITNPTSPAFWTAEDLREGLTVVTGGGGFIGSHLVEQLVDSGHQVRVIEKPGVSVQHLPRAVEVHFADIRHPGALVRPFQGARWVYHLAANPNLWAHDRGEF